MLGVQKQNLKCGACNIGYDKTHWTANQVKHHVNRGTILVCQKCSEKGCTTTDTRLYTCSACHETYGSKFFGRQDKYHSNEHHNKKLLCTKCQTESHMKVRHLKHKMTQSQRRCKCYCPIHQDRCPLSPFVYGDRRWPGSDGYISATEREWLDKLKPVPDWWSRAWGR